MKNWPWYAYIILAVIVFGLAYLLHFKPQNAELQRIKSDRLKIEAEVARLQEKKKELDKVEMELVTLDQTLKELEVFIPKQKEIDVILRGIQQLAYDTRLDIIRFAPRGEISMEFYSEWPIPIEIRGNYHNLAIFFDRLSKFARIFNIENFTIKPLTNQTDDLTISSSFTAKTYIFKEEAAVAQEPAAKPTRRATK
ncbi:MAG: type 4a pilus biogenesis protein PilO [Candidatus Aminicenantales bacterium]